MLGATASAGYPLERIWTRLTGNIDWTLLLIVSAILALGTITLYSASYENPARLQAQMVNIAVALGIMWIAAQVPPQLLMRLAVPIYLVGLALLIGVAVAGEIVNGARRWLHVGIVRFQPSEMMKIAMPLMLAWFFHRYEATLKLREFIASGVILLVPVALIARQPDLGTALLVTSAGFYVIFLAGLSWRLILPVAIAGVIGIVLLVSFEKDICAPGVKWPGMHDYQKHRVCTLLDPTTDPLGKGFHIIQSTIAVGSGGLTGKGWLEGTQTHLEFIPERSTDFIFAVFSEEFGLVGNGVLLVLYLLLLGRGLYIAAGAATFFGRLLAGALTLNIFTYAFVNMGMVSGILPVVGVPLPLVSYGGTALVTLFLGIGILMSIHRHKKLVQT
jgi:rod shape determining protein RodA